MEIILKERDSLVSLLRNSVIQKCYSLERYHLVSFGERLVILIYYSGTYYEFVLMVSYFTAKGFLRNFCASFFISIFFPLSLRPFMYDYFIFVLTNTL